MPLKPVFVASPFSALVLLAASASVQAQPAAPAAPASAPADARAPATATLPTVTVRASADASAEGLKPPYAGGQVARGGRVGLLGSQDMMDTPFNVINFTQALIQNQQSASVGDVLQNDPAVRLARGFGNFQQLYLVRGLPVYSDDMSYNGLYGLLPRQYLAAELLERVEVLRGASAFLNGAAPGGSGLGGAINVVPKRAPNEALNEVTLGVESGGQGYAAADIARRFGPDRSLGVRLNLVRRDGDTSVDREERELSVASLGVDYRLGGLRVSADLGYQNHRLRASQPNVTIASGLPIPPAPDASNSIAQPWTFSNERDTFGTVRAEYDIAPALTAWAAYGARHGRERTDLLNPTVIDAEGDTLGFRFAGTRRDRIATGEFGLRGKLQTGSVGHSLSASYMRFRGNSNAPFAFSDFGAGFTGTIKSNLYAPVDSAPPPTTALIGETITRTRTSSFAVADTLSAFDDRLRVTLGARRQNIEDKVPAGGTDYDKSRTTPIGGVVVKLNPAVSIYGNYIEGLVRGDTAPATSGGQPIANPGAVFAPFRTKQSEAGVKLDGGNLGGTLSVFQSKRPIYSVDADTNRFEQTDRQKNRGLELSVFGQPLAGVRVLGGATWLDTDVSGQQAIGSPRWQSNIGLEWDVPFLPGLALNARALYTDPQYADAANLHRLPSWTRFDLGARYGFDVGAQRVTIRARVDNVADRSYWASAGGFPGAGYLVLGAPRTFQLWGTVEF